MSGRTDIKTSWKPRQGARCRVLPNAEEERAETPVPPGVWWCLSPAPDSGYWWLHPHDDVAHAAAATFGRYVARHISTLRAA